MLNVELARSENPSETESSTTAHPAAPKPLAGETARYHADVRKNLMNLQQLKANEPDSSG
ncbi:MAG: hypothetical protein CMO80_13790 [Verrucomicrobiales bacterium]|nr:hypothetical protein [Verrucomicrobiales bacterium]